MDQSSTVIIYVTEIRPVYVDEDEAEDGGYGDERGRARESLLHDIPILALSLTATAHTESDVTAANEELRLIL